jgi:hypothetical protein
VFSLGDKATSRFLSSRWPSNRSHRYETGFAVFDLIRSHRTWAGAVRCAFDLLELNGKELRRESIEKRKELLAELLCGKQLSLAKPSTMGRTFVGVSVFALAG